MLHVGKGSVDGTGVGKRSILPSSHTDGHRYFVESFQDGLDICRDHGAPDLVSTFTCKPKWPEISEALLLELGQQPCDRADINIRVYGLKLSKYIDDVRAGRIFGPVKPAVYTVEFQKARSAACSYPYLAGRTQRSSVLRCDLIFSLHCRRAGRWK